MLPTEAKERKEIPIVTGVLDYFPRALAEVARISKLGNDQHNPGQPLHWDKTKSTDHSDCIGRHLVQRGTVDTDGGRHSAKLAWRALALLETELELEEQQKSPVNEDRAVPDSTGYSSSTWGPFEGGGSSGLVYRGDPRNAYSDPEKIALAKKALGLL